MAAAAAGKQARKKKSKRRWRRCFCRIGFLGIKGGVYAGVSWYILIGPASKITNFDFWTLVFCLRDESVANCKGFKQERAKG